MLVFDPPPMHGTGEPVVDAREIRSRVMGAVGPAFGGGTPHTHVSVPEGGQYLPVALVRGIEAAVDQLPRIGAYCTQVQLRHVPEHQVRARGLEEPAVATAIDAHHQGKAAPPGRLDTGSGIFDDDRSTGRHPEQPCSMEKHRRIRFARQIPLGGDRTVDDHVEHRLQGGGGQHGGGIAAAGDHCGGDPAEAQALQQREGAGEHGHSLFGQQRVVAAVFPVTDRVDGPRVLRVVGGAGGKADSPRGKKRRDTVRARPTVDIAAVLHGGIERSLRRPDARVA